MTTSQLEYVGFWARLVACALDTFILLVITIPLLLVIFGAGAIFGGSFYFGSPDFLTSWLIPFAFVFLFWSFWQATPGKMAMGARIVDAKTGNAPGTLQLILRYVAYFISAIPFGLGFFWIAFDRKKRGWHDLIAGTIVVRKVNRVEFTSKPHS